MNIIYLDPNLYSLFIEYIKLLFKLYILRLNDDFIDFLKYLNNIITIINFLQY